MKATVATALFLALGLPLAAPAQDLSEVITRQYADGGIYEGTFLDGLQHGQGTYRLPNGFEYTGEWEHGQITGTGTARYPNGSVYEGQFEDGRPHGQGRMVFADGSSYDGHWDAGRIMGEGTRRYVTGVVYTGTFDDSQPHGRGIMERPGGLRYEGEWQHGLREGMTLRGVLRPTRENERLFEKFYRPGNELRSKTKGSGLGLYIVRRFVEESGGRIRAHSDGEDRGAVFSLWLPASEEVPA